VTSERESVSVERVGPVTTVILDRRATRNSVDGPTAARLAEAFRAFESDEEASVAVLYGAGGHFCAGADLSAVGTDRGNVMSIEGDGPMGVTRLSLSKPVVAAVEGYAVAGGLELALWCDLRVAGDDAIFGVFCRRWGVPLVDGGTVRLPRLIGAGRALDLVLTGRAVPAEEARDMGLVDRVVASGHAREAAEQLAAQIATFPQTCMRNDRRSLYYQDGRSEAEAMAYEFELGQRSLNVEGLAGARRFRDGAGRHGALD
jgi:enoyl-CoA hydratase